MSSALPLARLGFLTQGVLCLVLLAQAIAAIGKQRVDDHQRSMLRVSAILFDRATIDAVEPARPLAQSQTVAP